MSAHTATHWSDAATCPFCGDDLPNPGAGFVDHISESSDCEAGFDVWRRNVAGDLGGTWTG